MSEKGLPTGIGRALVRISVMAGGHPMILSPDMTSIGQRLFTLVNS
jgi:hypothetical protein